MSDPRPGISLTTLARLMAPMPQDDLKSTIKAAIESAHLIGNSSLDARSRFTFADALAIDVARTLNDDSGIPLIEALRIVAYTGAIENYHPRYPTEGWGKTATDFWLGIIASRADWPDAPRGKWPIKGFGPDECWHTMHFHGTFSAITQEMALWMRDDEERWPDSEPCRIIMANVSAVDRRLGFRVEKLGIEIVGNEFAGSEK